METSTKDSYYKVQQQGKGKVVKVKISHWSGKQSFALILFLIAWSLAADWTDHRCFRNVLQVKAHNQRKLHKSCCWHHFMTEKRRLIKFTTTSSCLFWQQRKINKAQFRKLKQLSVTHLLKLVLDVNTEHTKSCLVVNNCKNLKC